MKRLAHVVLAAAMVVTNAIPALAAAYDRDAAADFVQWINEERAAAGLPPLVVHVDLVDGAELQAAAIEQAGFLFHNGDLGSVTTGWLWLGENVAYASTPRAAHEALMDSPGHRANILKRGANGVGVGVVDDGRRYWVAEVFAEFATPPEDSFTPPFRDDDGSVHEESIIKLADAGITAGCGPERYCPEDAVTREQMASFLVRALGLSPVSGDAFSDDDGSVHERNINALAAAGITAGCGSGRFCPKSRVTRAQMASFLVRALDLAPVAGDAFSDDDGSVHERAINALAGAGITSGCGPGRFCPDAPVTRAQMASFLVRALGL